MYLGINGLQKRAARLRKQKNSRHLRARYLLSRSLGQDNVDCRAGRHVQHARTIRIGSAGELTHFRLGLSLGLLLAGGFTTRLAVVRVANWFTHDD